MQNSKFNPSDHLLTSTAHSNIPLSSSLPDLIPRSLLGPKRTFTRWTSGLNMGTFNAINVQFSPVISVVSVITWPYFSYSRSLKVLTGFCDFQPLLTLLAKAFLREKIFIDWHG